MNRYERRQRAVIQRHNNFYNSYVRHLPEVGPEVLGKPGVSHMVLFHDKWCGIYDGKDCNCGPEVKIYGEPRRT